MKSDSGIIAERIAQSGSRDYTDAEFRERFGEAARELFIHGDLISQVYEHGYRMEPIPLGGGTGTRISKL